MLNKIKFLGIILMSIFLLTNCNKEAKQDPVNEGELVFAPITITPDKDWDWQCDLTLTVTNAHVVIDGNDYFPLTFVLDGKLYTQAIKLAEGIHTVSYFALIDNTLDWANLANAPIVKATPATGSYFGHYVTDPVDFDIYITAFRKFELRIEVLCYVPAVYEYFGFFWFEVRELTIRYQCFFGDFCIKHLPDYYGSLYENNGLQLDEVAIFKIKAYRNGDDIGTFYNTYVDDNELMFHEPLCVEYADYDNETDYFDFELWIYVKVGDVFEYVYFYTWTFMDDELIVPLPIDGGDGVVDFVLGNCNYSPTDLLLPPYMNLPWYFDYMVTTDNPDAYFNAHFAGIGPGYDIQDGIYPAWCADSDHFITPGAVYSMCAFSSLYLNLLPTSCNPVLDWSLKHDEFGRLNWIFNNLGSLPGYNAAQMQDAIWLTMGFPVPGADATSLAIAGLAAPHANFSPLPGGWAAVLYFDMADCINVQITFRVVDP
jgi:hypothetical protein